MADQSFSTIPQDDDRIGHGVDVVAEWERGSKMLPAALADAGDVEEVLARARQQGEATQRVLQSAVHKEYRSTVSADRIVVEGAEDAEIQGKNQEGQTAESTQGHGRVQAREAQELERPDGKEPETGGGHSVERVRPGPQVLTVSAHSQKELDREVKKATKGKAVISRTDRLTYEAVVVYE